MCATSREQATSGSHFGVTRTWRSLLCHRKETLLEQTRTSPAPHLGIRTGSGPESAIIIVHTICARRKKEKKIFIVGMKFSHLHTYAIILQAERKTGQIEQRYRVDDAKKPEGSEVCGFLSDRQAGVISVSLTEVDDTSAPRDQICESPWKDLAALCTTALTTCFVVLSTIILMSSIWESLPRMLILMMRRMTKMK